MKNLRCCLKKDFLLFFNRGRGLFVIVCPLIIAFIMQLGLSQIAEVRSFIEPFPIAVRDEDQTPMTEMLVSNLQRIELFSEIIEATDETDAELLSRGAACIITIPKNYFYDVYEMGGVVEVVLNSEMEREASLCETMMRPILDIISMTQASYRAEYLLRYGDELSAESERRWVDAMAQAIIADVLTLVDRITEDDYVESLSNQTQTMLYSCVFSLLCFLIPLYTVKTIPEEYQLGIFTRYRAAGGSMPAAILSKLISALIIFSLVGCPFFLMLCNDKGAGVVTAFAAFFACFFVLLPLALAAKNSGRLLLISNAYLVASVVLGACLYPKQLFPNWAQFLGNFMLPTHLQNGYAALSFDTLAIFAILAATGLATSLLILKKGRSDGYARS
ncbi:MAG: ABC transporter permease [Clostridia bacterium]|nr:ABC transporter permease [Clostridia bacterium]